MRRSNGKIEVDLWVQKLLRGGAAVGVFLGGGRRCNNLNEIVCVHSSRVLVEVSVGLGVDAAAHELSLYMSVPIVLDLVVRSPRQPGSNERPSAKSFIKMKLINMREREGERYLLPSKLWRLMMSSSSSSVKFPLLRSGLR